MIPWRWVTAVLLVVAAVGAVVTASDASIVGRVAGVFSAALLIGVAVAVVRGHVWAYGSAFILGICWLTAVLALLAGGWLRTTEIVAWLAWSIVVIVGSVKSRGADAGQGVHEER